MPEVFVSYARPAERQAHLVADALRAEGFGVWLDDELRPHHAFGEVIEETLRASKAVVVVWSADAVKSQWVRAEADVAREAGTLVQLSIDGTTPPLPFNQIHCVDLAGWGGDDAHPAWRKVAASVSELMGEAAPARPAPTPRAPPLPDKPSIAVLPFSNLSREPDQDYFVEGMMDEVVTALSRIRSLFVIASASSRVLKEQGVDAVQAAHRLGVRYVLEGSVRRAGARVRIAVKLADSGGREIWAERFEDTLDDIFALQDQVALSVAGVIEPTVHAAESRRAARRPLESLDAYDLYLRAAALRATLRKTEVLQAIELLDRALALQPDFAPALAQAAGCHSQVVINNWAKDRETHRHRGLEMAERAIHAGPDDAAVLAQTANALVELDNGLGRAAALIERATRLNPGSAYAWFVGGMIKVIEGDCDDGIDHLQKAARLDPLSRLGEIARVHIAVARALNREFDEALRLFRQTTFRTPRVRAVIAMVYGMLDMPEEREAELARYAESTSVPIVDMVAVMSPSAVVRAQISEGVTRACAAPAL
jgi:adenylate cyclase